MTGDVELESWTALWRDAEDRPAPGLAEVRRRVARRTAVQAVRLGLEVALGALWVALSIVAVRRSSDPSVWLMAASIWVLTAVGLAFSITNSLGTWRPSSATVRAYVAMAVERGRRDLRAARVGLALTAVYTPFVLAWALANRGRFALPLALPELVVRLLPAAAPLLVVGLLLSWRRRAARELREWEVMRRDLSE